MRKRLIPFITTLVLNHGTLALATPRTVTLSIPSMNCATCPITVKKALSRVPGVTRIEVSLDKREAIVTFEDNRVSVDGLTRATANAGYPAAVLRER